MREGILTNRKLDEARREKRVERPEYDMGGVERQTLTRTRPACERPPLTMRERLARLARVVALTSLVALLVSPAFAAASRTELQASAAQTASGNSASFKISTIDHAVVGVDITAGSGTVSDFDLWLEVSDDGGTTWYPIAPNVVVIGSTRAAAWTTDLDDAYIVDSKASTTAETYLAQYPAISADYVRVRWTIAGTTPSLTFSVSLVGK